MNHSQRGITESPSGKSFIDIGGSVAAAAHGHAPPSRPGHAGLREPSGRGQIGGSGANAGNRARMISAGTSEQGVEESVDAGRKFSRERREVHALSCGGYSHAVGLQCIGN